MDRRAARPDDVDAIVELSRRWEAARFGRPERDADEVRETFGGEQTLAERSLLVFKGDRLLAAAWYGPGETTVLVDPDAEPAPFYRELLPWLAARATGLDALADDEQLQSALIAQGWTHHHSSFELIRDLDADWVLSEPRWPAGITVASARAEDAEAIHRVIYVDAAWAEVPGHPDREFASWREMFLTDKEPPEQQVLAWRGDRLVGVALGRIFSDGAGWVTQLAVAKPERGRGLGRALLLESLRRQVAAGATLLGLSVEGENRSALQLYLDVGLTLDREWQKFTPPPR